jgi:large subunit ribosomal protein L18
MSTLKKKTGARRRRKASIRKRVSGTAQRPRLTVYRSNKHIYAQVVDDSTGRSVAAASTLSKTLDSDIGGKKKTEVAKIVGGALAKLCIEKGIKQVVFDRNGYCYHGRVSALATGAREGGLEF